MHIKVFKYRKGFIIDWTFLSHIPWQEIANHILTSRLEMFTLFGEAYLSLISCFASLFTHKPANWIWIAIAFNCLYSQFFTWGPIVYCLRNDIDEIWLIFIGLVLDFAITAIPNHWWEALTHIGTIILLFMLKYIADEHQYYNHARQINRHRH